jgi:hypothetical protein
MINYNTLGNDFKGVLVNLSKNISKILSKPNQRFIADMIYGINAAQSCKFTEIGRELKEDISLKQTEKRLVRNIVEFDEIDRAIVNDCFVKEAKKSSGDDTMALIDGGDLTKSCSPKMENIGIVHDGSTGKLKPGYWTMGCVILSENHSQPIPVYDEDYACKKQGGNGYNAELEKCLEHIRRNFDKSVVRVLDSGNDSGNTFNIFCKNEEKFIIRAHHNRKLIHKGKTTKLDDVVRGLNCCGSLEYTDKSGKLLNCEIGMTTVTIPKSKALKINLKLNLVVCKSHDEKPLVIYTNLDEDFEVLATRIVKAYLMRWRIEEFYAFKKERGLKLEDFRVRSFNAIKNINMFATIAAGLVAIISEKLETKMTLSLIAASKRIQKIGDFVRDTKFLLYAVSDGIERVLSKLMCGIRSFFKPKSVDYQLYLEML